MSAADSPTRVLIIDDHVLLCEGLRALIDQDPRFAVIGTVSTAEEALDFVRRHAPNLAIVDVRLDGVDGITCIRQLHARRPNIRFIVLSMFGDAVCIERARRAGAHAFVSKSDAAQELMAALCAVAGGKTFFPGGAGAGIGAVGGPGLTNREALILDLVGAGHPNRTIARKLGISPKTVDCHKQNLRRKLGLATSAELRAYARRRYFPVPAAAPSELDRLRRSPAPRAIPR